MTTRRWAAMAVGVLCAGAGIYGQAAGQAPQTAPPLKETTATEIPGVIRGGTRIVLLRDGFNGTEGVIAGPDGSALFTEQDADRIIRVDPDDRISTFLEQTNRTIGLAYDPKGRLVGAQSRDPRIAVLAPEPRTVLADRFNGQPLVRPNDLVIDRKGGIYFTDPLGNPQQRFREPPPGRKPLLFYIRPDGTLMSLTEEVTNPNGVQLSPDEKTLYATNGQTILRFDVQPDGGITNGRVFAQSGGDGLAIDTEGRLYSAVGGVQGIRVFAPDGKDLGTIPVGTRPQSVGFAGPDKRTLYIVGQGALYKAPMIAQGILTRAK